MKPLIKPPCLRRGDKVAAVSLSSGLAGEPSILHRYNLGKQRLMDVFGLELVEMPHTLSGTEYIYAHPEKRAEDLMQAFADSDIKAVISCIGGDDSIRLLPYIDYDVIRRNPKIYTGYSDSTVTHLMCLKAGLSSFYGASILNDFAEYVSMSDYTVKWIEKVLFSPEPIGSIETSDTFTAQYLPWDEKNINTARTFEKNGGYELVCGSGKASGCLIGGCLEVLDIARGTSVFPDLECFDGAILFLETSEVHSPEWLFEDILRGFGAMGILNRVNGIIFGKPQAGVLYEEYKPIIRKVIRECGIDIPVFYNASFGHNEPKCLIPFGAEAELDCDAMTFTLGTATSPRRLLD